MITDSEDGKNFGSTETSMKNTMDQWIDAVAPGLTVALLFRIWYSCMVTFRYWRKDGSTIRLQMISEDVIKSAHCCEIAPSRPVHSNESAILEIDRKFLFGSKEDRDYFARELPAIGSRLQGFINDPRFLAMRGIQGELNGTDVIIEELAQDSAVPESLQVRIHFVTKHCSTGSQNFKSVMKKANIPAACKLFFEELAKRSCEIH